MSKKPISISCHGGRISNAGTYLKQLKQSLVPSRSGVVLLDSVSGVGGFIDQMGLGPGTGSG